MYTFVYAKLLNVTFILSLPIDCKFHHYLNKNTESYTLTCVQTLYSTPLPTQKNWIVHPHLHKNTESYTLIWNANGIPFSILKNWLVHRYLFKNSKLNYGTPLSTQRLDGEPLFIQKMLNGTLLSVSLECVMEYPYPYKNAEQ